MIRDCSTIVQYLCDHIRAQVDIAVIGLSGGADSSVTAILCMCALGKENVYGISMPYNEVDLNTFNSLSAKLAKRIGIHHLVRPVSQIADSINNQIYIASEAELTDLNKGNSRSRARMCVLYGVSRTLDTIHQGKRVRVMGTGNLSEDFIGYDTKGGDALADIFPIGEFFKSEVYQLLEHFRELGIIEEEHINRVPSAGLVENQTDEGDLGYSYNEMEPGIRFCLEHYSSMSEQLPDPITDFVWRRHLIHRHKHEAPVVVKIRHLCD